MDFDEYDYLEKTVESSEPEKVKESVNGEKHARDRDRSRSSKHKSDENDADREHRSKRSKNGDESRDHGRHREGGSSRHRSLSKDGEKDRHRSSRERREKDRDANRDERYGRDKDRERGKDRDHDRERRHRDRESEREKEVELERSRRSRSRSERHRSERDDKEREMSRDRETREKEREKERESRRHKEKKEEVTEPEIDPERDQRTVFAFQISLKADERDVYEFFSRAGKVRDVRLIMDRNSRRSKGVGYIEFYDVMSVPMAIALSGQPLLGQPVMVKPSEAEKNLVQSTAGVAAALGGIIPYSGGARRLYVGNLHFNITEDQLRQVFAPFGTVELVQLPLDESGQCKGFGFVQFGRLEDARNAQSLNGQLEIAGRVIKVSAVTDQAGLQDIGANAADFDDDEGGGLSLNARSRALLMQKLDRTGTASSIVGTLGTTAAPVSPLVNPLLQGAVPSLIPPVLSTADTIGVPSECLLLKNMFDPKIETEPDFDLDIKEDVQDECSKFGTLRHIHVNKNSAGFVYLRFEDTQSAMNAQRSLHGRWFAGKMITATYMLPDAYETQFPESR